MPRLTALLLLIALAFCQAGASSPGLFYTPPGTSQESYRRGAAPARIAAYPARRERCDGAVLFIHGGGWAAGGAGLPLYADWEGLVHDANLRAFAVEHRLPPRYRGRDQVEDIIAAIAYVQRNADRFGVPADRIALIGFSSGGHLAALSSLILSSRGPSRPSPVRAVVAYYAPLDLEHLALSGNEEMRRLLSNYLPEFPLNVGGPEAQRLRENYMRRLLRDVSPLPAIHGAMPPMLLIHGDADELVPVEQSRSFYERAEEVAPGRVELRIVPGAPHNFEGSRSRWARELEEEAIDFIDRELGR